MPGINKLARLFSGQYSLMSLLGNNGVRVLLYHHIAEQDNEFIDHLGIRVHPDEFKWQLDLYARDYDVINLETALSGRLPRRPLLITFDDAYRTVLDVAAPMLKERGLPALFFLSSEVVSGDGLMLDNLLNLLANQIGIGALETALTEAEPQYDNVPTLISEVVAKMPYEQRSRLADELSARYGLDPVALRRDSNLYLEPSDLPELKKYGIDIGCHTGSHAHCSSLDANAAEIEVIQAKRHLEEMSGLQVRVFSYPYSDRASDVAQQIIRRAGFKAEFLVNCRAMSRKHAGPIWYRTSVDSSDPESLFVEIEILPRLRAIKHSFG
jgi:peptidoglycan/xylan/chitin deacetylase (PgdA/CDA1 family)